MLQISIAIVGEELKVEIRSNRRNKSSPEGHHSLQRDTMAYMQNRARSNQGSFPDTCMFFTEEVRRSFLLKVLATTCKQSSLVDAQKELCQVSFRKANTTTRNFNFQAYSSRKFKNGITSRSLSSYTSNISLKTV